MAEKAVIVDPGGPINLIESKPNFFATAEGFYDFENFRYIYQYKDHLGNARLNYGRDVNGELFTEDGNDYYPFGLNFINPLGGAQQVFNPSATYKNYKFQEQELQETGFYSFKWRNYMPDVGRFFNVDPLSEKYSFQSHYNFSENRVVNARELEGLEALVVNGQELSSAKSSMKKFATTMGFASVHPQAAFRIGTDEGSKSISGIAHRFSSKIASGNKADQNAIRHGIWSAMIGSEFGSSTALQAGNAHEGIGIASSQNVDMSKTFKGKGESAENLADSIVDVMNNNIGIGIAESNPNAGTKDLATMVLGELKNNGMWTVSNDKNGNVSITRSKITESQYNTGVKTINSLNNNGNTGTEQKKLDDTKKTQNGRAMSQTAGF